MLNIPTELKNAICNNQLLIFVGAGLSFNLVNKNNHKLKGWSNLVEQILIHLKGKGFETDYLIPVLKKQDPIVVLNLIEADNDIPKKNIYSFINDFLDLKKSNNLELHKKLYKLSKKIITTNYDTAFENAVHELYKNTAYKGKNYELTTHKDPNASLLFKIHGCYLNVDSMVLFPTNYDDLYDNTNRDAEHSLLVLRNIIMNKSILFIGTGMGDFQINNIFSEVKKLQGDYNQKHFIITNKPIDSSLSFLTAINVKNHSEIESFIDVLIELKEEYGNKESKENLKLKDQLIKAHKQLEKLNLEKNNDKNRLEKGALKCFAKGLEFNLINEGKKAIEEYEFALQLKPDLYEALYSWGNCLGYLAKTKEGKESEELYNQAFEKFKKALKIKPDKHEAFNNWGTYLGNLAKTKEGKESEELYNEAFEKFKKAIEIKPDNHEALYNWGTDLGILAEKKEGKESEELYNQAFEKFKKALKIKPDKHEAFNNWGNCLVILAEKKEGKESEELYNQAFEKFKKAIEIKPDKHEALYNWGNCLVILAEKKEGKESEELYNQAFEKFKKAIEIKPDNHEALYNWGTSLGNLAKTKEGKESEELYNQAFEKFKKAIEYGASSYNLSCIYASRNDKKNAFKYLNISLKNDEIDIDFVEKDEDWLYYLKDKEFIELLRNY